MCLHPLAGAAALQLRKARCASTSAAERLEQTAGSAAGGPAVAAATLQLHGPDCLPLLACSTHTRSPAATFGRTIQHAPLGSDALSAHLHALASETPRTSAAVMLVPTAVAPAFGAWSQPQVQLQHGPGLLQGDSWPAHALSTPGTAAPTSLPATPAWAVARPAWGGRSWGGAAAAAGTPAAGQEEEWGLAEHHAGDGSSGWGYDSDDEEGGGHMALDSLVCLEDFNGHISRVRHSRGKRGA